MKTCSKCGTLKLICDFYKQKDKKDGLTANCKICCGEGRKRYRKDNPDKIKEAAKRYYETHPEKVRERIKRYSEANREKLRDRARKYRELNSDKYRESVRRYKKANLKKSSDWKRCRMTDDINYRIRVNLRSRLNSALKNKQKVGSAIQDLGCTGQYLTDYLESLWTEGMTWDNYGNKEGNWSIDHIAPLSAFNLEDRQHFLLANHYLNLRPLWHVENMIKNDTLPWELAA